MITMRPPKRVTAAVFGTVLLTGLAGCGGASTTAAVPPAPSVAPSTAPPGGVLPTVTPIQPANGLAPAQATATIRMYIDHPFDPATLTVAPATLITVINEGTGSNDICNLSDPDHGINSNDIGPGASTHITAPDTPGTYNYKCTYYPDTMKGTLIVSKDVTTPSSAAPVTPTPTDLPSATPTPVATSRTSSGGTTTGSPSGGSDTGGSPSSGSDTGGSDSGGPDTGGPSAEPTSTPSFDPVKRAHQCTKPVFRAKHPHICAPYPSQDPDGPDQ